MKLIWHHWTEGDNVILTVESEPSRAARLFGAKPKRRHFIGSCTVWHQIPGFRRAGSSAEASLADIWERLRFEKLPAGQKLRAAIAMGGELAEML